MDKLFEERNHMENLLNMRFNFFLVIFLAIVATIINIENLNQFRVILIIGSVLEYFLALVIYRAQSKLDILIKMLKKNRNHAVKVTDDIANKGFLLLPCKRSKRKIVGYILPTMILFALFYSVLFPTSIYSYLKNSEIVNHVTEKEDIVETHIKKDIIFLDKQITKDLLVYVSRSGIDDKDLRNRMSILKKYISIEGLSWSRKPDIYSQPQIVSIIFESDFTRALVYYKKAHTYSSFFYNTKNGKWKKEKDSHFIIY